MTQTKKTKIALFLFLVLVFVPQFAAAKIMVQIYAEGPFALGEKTYFDYSISSDSDVNVVFTPYIKCPTAPNALLQDKKISLRAGETYSGTYSGIEIMDFFEPQECVAYVQVKSPESVREEKKFRIDVAPSFDFWAFACTDEKCANKSRFFALGEKVYFGFESAVPGAEVSMELTALDKNTTEQIMLPYSVGAGELGLGTYELKATAKKEGYKIMKTSFQFAVIEKHAEIPSASQCTADGACTGAENPQNCPQDCPFVGAGLPQAPEQPAEPSGFDWPLVIGVVVLIAVLVAAYFKIFKPLRVP